MKVDPRRVPQGVTTGSRNLSRQIGHSRAMGAMVGVGMSVEKGGRERQSYK